MRLGTLNTSPAHPLVLESTVLLQNNEIEDQRVSSHQNGGSLSIGSQGTIPITTKQVSIHLSEYTYPTINIVSGCIPSFHSTSTNTPIHCHTVVCNSPTCMTTSATHAQINMPQPFSQAPQEGTVVNGLNSRLIFPMTTAYFHILQSGSQIQLNLKLCLISAFLKKKFVKILQIGNPHKPPASSATFWVLPPAFG